MLIKATSHSPGRSSGFASSVSYMLVLVFGLPCTLLNSETSNSVFSDDIVFVCFLYPRVVFFWPPSHRTNNSFTPSGKVHFCKTFSMQSCFSKISCSSFGYQLPFTTSSLKSTNLYTRRFVPFLGDTAWLTVKCCFVQDGM